MERGGARLRSGSFRIPYERVRGPLDLSRAAPAMTRWGEGVSRVGGRRFVFGASPDRQTLFLELEQSLYRVSLPELLARWLDELGANRPLDVLTPNPTEERPDDDGNG